ncbi:MAG: argininosuccinate lyase [Acidobacteria bacterium]|nr:argininosuccinate lyase [Acidobacteriota bacterium]
MKLWGGRFEAGPSEVFEKFGESLHFDKRLVDADIRGSQAFARALSRVGILNASELDTLLSVFETMRKEAATPAFFAGATDEDVHTLVIRKLKEKTPLADKIHTGRSRNEQVSLDVRLWLRDEIDGVRKLLVDLLGSVLTIADKYSDAIIPGYTHMRRAQAVLWPHYCLAYFEMLARDLERLDQTRARVDVMPLGSGALAGSGFPFDREAIAKDLGFGAITKNSMDVSADRDWALDFMHFANLTVLHLSRLSEDWILYSSEEFGWLDLGDGVTSGSSLMPQKKNPDSLELIRGKSGRVVGDYLALMTTMKGLPLTYNRDMQEDKEPLFDAVDQVAGCLMMAKVVVDTTRLNPALPRQAAEVSWVVATDLAEELARRGTPFHQAHQLVGKLVLHSVRHQMKPSDWTVAELEKFAPQFTAEFARLLNPAEGMKSRELPGGTGPQAVAQALKLAKERLNGWKA